MLAALVVWRQLLTVGPEAVGRTDYIGAAPVLLEDAPLTVDTPLADVLASDVAGVRAETFVDPQGRPGQVLGIDLWASLRADPCEVRFRYAAANAADATPMPKAIEVRFGNTLFGVFTIQRFTITPSEGREAGKPPADGGESAAAANAKEAV